MPPGAYIWRGDLTEGFFYVTSLGDLYLEGLISGILRYFESFTSSTKIRFYYLRGYDKRCNEILVFIAMN